MPFNMLVENQLGKKIKAIQINNAKVFLVVTKFLQTQWISHRLSCHHTHEQNGWLERKQRHIVETGLILLANTSLPLSFCGEAFHAATSHINLFLTPILKHQSSFQTLIHKTLNCNFLLTFGHAFYPLLRPYQNQKLEFQSKQCIFLGYAENHKGYKCLSKSSKVYISGHFNFDE